MQVFGLLEEVVVPAETPHRQTQNGASQMSQDILAEKRINLSFTKQTYFKARGQLSKLRSQLMTTTRHDNKYWENITPFFFHPSVQLDCFYVTK